MNYHKNTWPANEATGGEYVTIIHDLCDREWYYSAKVDDERKPDYCPYCGGELEHAR